MAERVSNCHLCQRELMTNHFRYYGLEGYIVGRKEKTYEALLCRDCARKLFWKVQSDTFIRGWWSLSCLIGNPYAMLLNLVRYLWGTRKLPRER
jgi:hypothetical protein